MQNKQNKQKTATQKAQTTPKDKQLRPNKPGVGNYKTK